MENKKRVLFVSPSSLNNGGVQYVLMNIVRSFCDVCSFDIIVFNSTQNFYKEEFLSYGGKIYNFPSSEGKNKIDKITTYFLKRWNYRKRLKNLFKHKTYDIIHCCNHYDADIFVKISKKNRVYTRIVHSNGCFNFQSKLKRLIRKMNLKVIKKYATDFIACSFQSFVSFFGNDFKPNILYAPLNNSVMFSSKKPNKIVLIQIGLFCNNKNQTFSLDVIDELNKYADSELILLGNGDSRTIRDYIQNKHLEKNVTILEGDFDKNIAFQKSSYFIFPSKLEGFGIVLIEAQAAGLKCFASNSVPKETNCGGVTYLSLSSGAKKWAEIIYNEFLLDGGKKNNYDCTRFSQESFVLKISKLYNIKKI